MKGMVQGFFDKHVPILDQWITSKLSLDAENKELRRYLEAARKEWHSIPLEEKQIPYLGIEKPFWHAFHTLSFLFTSDLERWKKEKLFSEFDIIRESYLKRGPLPEGHDAMRPLP